MDEHNGLLREEQIDMFIEKYRFSVITPDQNALRFAQWLGMKGYVHYADVRWHIHGQYPSLKNINDLLDEFIQTNNQCIR